MQTGALTHWTASSFSLHWVWVSDVLCMAPIQAYLQIWWTTWAEQPSIMSYMYSIWGLLTLSHLHDEQLNLWLAMAVPSPCHICGCVSVFSYFDNFHWPQGRCQLAFPSLHLSCTGDGIGTNARDCCRLCRSVHVLGINHAPGEGGMKMHYW